MAKIKSEKVESNGQQSEIEQLKATVAKHEETLENFRTSFKNIDEQLKNLKDRNRLR
jgi:archaellum component FlaC